MDDSWTQNTVRQWFNNHPLGQNIQKSAPQRTGQKPFNLGKEAEKGYDNQEQTEETEESQGIEGVAFESDDESGKETVQAPAPAKSKGGRKRKGETLPAMTNQMPRNMMMPQQMFMMGACPCPMPMQTPQMPAVQQKSTGGKKKSKTEQQPEQMMQPNPMMGMMNMSFMPQMQPMMPQMAAQRPMPIQQGMMYGAGLMQPMMPQMMAVQPQQSMPVSQQIADQQRTSADGVSQFQMPRFRNQMPIQQMPIAMAMPQQIPMAILGQMPMVPQMPAKGFEGQQQQMPFAFQQMAMQNMMGQQVPQATPQQKSGRPRKSKA